MGLWIFRFMVSIGQEIAIGQEIMHSGRINSGFSDVITLIAV